jgi:peptide/nickel transport system substrate-binding protein
MWQIMRKIGFLACLFCHFIGCFISPTVALSRADSAIPVDGDWLIAHLSAEPGTLNPITATDAYASNINDYIYESLLKRDERSLELVPVLAESWEIAEDHLTYIFHLKRNIRWQDGAPFTAKDVLFSYERIQDPKVDAAHLRNYYRDIETLEALDDYTVRYRYRIPYFRALEFCGGIPIVPAHLFKDSDDFNQHPIGRQPVGTGPYRLLKWNTGEQLVLERDEKYWGEKPHLQRIVFKIVTDSTVALEVLKQGGLDYMSLRPIQWAKQTQSQRFQQNFNKFKYYLPSYNYIGWNLRKPLFQDRRVRQAMTMLLNREPILQKILFGLGTMVTGPFYVNSPDYDHNIQPYPYDPKAALELLHAAGWQDHDSDGLLDREGVRFEFEFLVSAGSKFAEQLATLLQENLKRVGIKMSIRKLEWAVFIQKIQSHEFDACTLGWSLGWDADPFQVWHSSQIEKGSNFVGFQNAEADHLIEEARKEFDADQRHRMFHRFHQIIHEEQPYTFLFTTEALVAVDRRFANVQVYPLGMAPREWWVPLQLQRYQRVGE